MKRVYDSEIFLQRCRIMFLSTVHAQWKDTKVQKRSDILRENILIVHAVFDRCVVAVTVPDLKKQRIIREMLVEDIAKEGMTINLF